MANFADLCCADVTAKLQAIQGGPLRDSVLTVFSEADFKNKSKMLKTPFAGVMYGGMVAAQDQAGRMTDLAIGVLLGVASFQSASGDAAQTEAWTILAQMRKALLFQTTPTGHFWKFKSEIYVGDEKNIAFFIQQWAT